MLRTDWPHVAHGNAIASSMLRIRRSGCLCQASCCIVTAYPTMAALQCTFGTSRPLTRPVKVIERRTGSFVGEQLVGLLHARIRGLPFLALVWVLVGVQAQR